MKIIDSPLSSKDKKGKEHNLSLIQWNISGFVEVYTTSDMYIINMMYILLNIIEMHRFICSSFGLVEYTRIPSVYKIVSCISSI